MPPNKSVLSLSDLSLQWIVIFVHETLQRLSKSNNAENQKNAVDDLFQTIPCSFYSNFVDVLFTKIIREKSVLPCKYYNYISGIFNRHLRELSLSDCNLFQDSSSVLEEFLTSSNQPVSNCKSLKIYKNVMALLDFDPLKLTHTLSSYFPNISVMIVQGLPSELDRWEVLNFIKKLVANSPFIQCLDLSGSNIDDKTCEIIGSSLNALHTLQLNNCLLTSAGVSNLLKNKNLVRLDCLRGIENLVRMVITSSDFKNQIQRGIYDITKILIFSNIPLHIVNHPNYVKFFKKRKTEAHDRNKIVLKFAIGTSGYCKFCYRRILKIFCEYETKKLADHVHEHGITQFINSYEKLKHRHGDDLKWGDEVEYFIIKFKHSSQEARVCLKAMELLSILQKPKIRGDKDLNSIWVPEYAAYMVEGTPGVPYGGGSISQFNRIEANMKMRRNEVRALLEDDESILSITNFPRLGCSKFTYPEIFPLPESEITRSLFWPDAAIYPSHPRFKTLSRNIRERRGEKVAIDLPIFKDKYTEEVLKNDPGYIDGKEGHVHCDAMGFGMGMCCLQVTFQATNVDEARILYDQLAPLCPILLALTAATPTCRGYLVDRDCRWDTISASVDCRTQEERGLLPLSTDKFVIPKSRYDSIIYDKDIYEKLIDNQIDTLLAKHISHLFIRDPISVFSEKVHQDDNKETDHFENIQSTNWQTMRFKIPPVDPKIGWRVEFRPCEIQFTDFENSSIVCFVVLLTRTILTKVYFRINIADSDAPPEIEELTIHEIFNGTSEFEFPGLISLIKSYLSNQNVETDTMCTLCNYLHFIERRASTELITNAKFIREFILDHPDYKQDSVISERINYDLLIEIDKITDGVLKK
ncbi:GCLC [Lepeophtheirus salmonis]|uniref:Glutamate--cysteine ligase n=1 Tax=Lepeophtheirus salmonis TaxID=72036 RepID=A0A7R8HAE8_LEPSM|nr:GCLC [Lepeophtheirus salmonis]CAF2955618.1 GCLC [Lepeophtheirus salmonis]